MKRLSVTFERAAGGETRLVPAPGGREGVVRNLQVCRDGSVLELCRYATPDAAAVADALADDPGVRDHAIVDERTLYVHLEPGAVVKRLLDLLETYRLILDTPLGFDADRVTVRLVGRADRISDAAAALPDDVRADMRVERLTDYTAETEGLRGALTDRQREVLAAAVAVGYYENPRDATVADVADALGVSVSTASEHLRKVEARVLPRLSGT